MKINEIILQIDCMHTRWIHSSGLLLVPDDSSKFSQSASKLNDNGSDSKVKLDHMEKLTHFRDNIKSQTTEKQQSSGTSDLAGVNTDVHPDVLEARSMQEGGYRLPHPIWTEDEVSSVKITHRPPVTVSTVVILELDRYNSQPILGPRRYIVSALYYH